MAKSKIIKELANGTVSLSVALKRTKILLQEFDNDELSQWVNYELVGYPNVDALPSYRITKGKLSGTYIRGDLKYTNVSIPLGSMPKDKADILLEISFTEGVESLGQFLTVTKDQTLGKDVPADFFPNIAFYNNDPFLEIVSARVIVYTSVVQRILTTVESKLLDLLCYLEKQFGNLDDLDIDLSTKTEIEQQEIVDSICTFIYNDHSITIGENCKIKDSTVASTIE